MTNKETAYQKIENLVNRFAEQEEYYKRATYNETETRRDFIDPFFDALGWDVDNKKGLLPTEREVNHERRVDVKGHSKSADYSFNSKGKIKFFVEAKKPSVSLKDNPEPAIQIRTYAWNAKLNISILTDFEEFVIYDCTKKILKTDKASKCRIKFVHYKNYLKEFDFIYNTFSKECVENGSLEQFAHKNINEREKETVDIEFLNSLESWRTYLATNIALNNKELDEDEINFCVQQTIDRIVFLKICEDREIENIGNLKKCTKKGNYYKNLFQYFKSADQKYNSGIFDFKKDTLTEKLKIENKIIENIINDFDEIGFDFSKIPIEILGFAYEQFLGKVIRLEKSGHAVIETKPEVRKAGGVFYTPEYIVEYIVKSTVGKLIENKTPDEISKIKILDPACGSGSFLLGAYQFLLNYYQNYYIQNSKGKITKNSPINQDGFLTTAEKKRILINNIFGVDIDLQAVEVTKLSLLIKSMEGETPTSVETSLQLFHERVLPSLENNILSGNSLIGNDFYDNELFYTPKEKRKINAFDWQTAFKDIFKSGGFDCVIGNPPWVSLNGKFGNEILSTYAQKYLIEKFLGNTYMPNLYEYFVHQGFELINDNGLFSFIIPDRLGFNSQFISLRKKIVMNYNIEELIYKAKFPNITADTLIFRFSKKTNSNNYTFLVGEFGKPLQSKSISDYKQDKENKFEYQSNDNISLILQKIFAHNNCKPLNEIIESTSGFGGKSTEITEKQKSKKQIKILRGRNIHKYSIAGEYFFEFVSKNITGRTTDKTKLGIKEKVLLRKTGFPIFAAYDNSERFPEQSLYFLFKNKTNMSLKYFAALINSNLFQFVYINKLVTNKDSTPQLKKVDLDIFPVRIINFEETQESELHDKIVKYVEKIMHANNEKSKSKLQSDIETLNREITFSENQINKHIYQLYNILSDEIEIIENVLNKSKNNEK